MQVQEAVKYIKVIRVRWLTQSLNSATKRLCHDSSSGNSESEKETKIDEEKSKNKNDEEKSKKTETRQRMNELLKSLKVNTTSYYDKEIKLSRPQPKTRRETLAKKKSRLQVDKEEDEVIDFSLKTAARDVAEHLGGDVAETESELITSLKSHSSPKQNLSELLAEMKVYKRPKTAEESDDLSELSRTPRSKLYDFKLDGMQGRFPSRQHVQIDLFGSKPLKIFPRDHLPSKETESFLPTWDAAVEREKIISVSHSPRNYFEEMIKWTEQGKVWTFPIDNEVGLEEEKAYTFADHIFLEKHLEGWCPEKGPIRVFMELVCVGLGKNPYLTVNRKRAHIQWYKDFFESKKEILEKAGAV